MNFINLFLWFNLKKKKQIKYGFFEFRNKINGIANCKYVPQTHKSILFYLNTFFFVFDCLEIINFVAAVCMLSRLVIFSIYNIFD